MQRLEEELEMDHDEIKKLSETLADILIQQSTPVYEVITEEEAIKIISLESLASSTAGILDPLGQLRDWLTSMFNSISSIITSSVEGFIETYVIPAINAVTSGIKWFIDTYVIPAIDYVYFGIRSFIDTYVIPAINSVYSSIRSFIDTYVIPAINAIPDTITEFLENYVIPAISGVVRGVADMINDIVIPAITGIIDFMSKSILPAIANVLTGITTFISETVIPTITTIFSSIVEFISTNVIPAIAQMATVIVDFISANVIPVIANVATVIINAITETIIPAITDVLSTITDLITEMILPAISKLFASLIDFISSNVIPVITQIADGIIGFISKSIVPLITKIIEFISANVIPVIANVLTGVVDFISANVIPVITGVATSIGNLISTTVIPTITEAFGGVVKVITSGITSLQELILKTAERIAEIPALIQSILSVIYDTVVKPFTETVGGILENVSAGFAQLSVSVTGFINAILQFPQWFPLWFERHISRPIIEAISRIPFIEPLTKFLTDPTGYLYGMVVTALNKLGWFIERAIETLKTILSSVINTGREIIEGVWDSLRGFAEWLYSSMFSLVKTVVVTISTKLVEISTTITKEIAVFLHKALESAFNSMKEVSKVVGGVVVDISNWIASEVIASIHSFHQKNLMDAVERYAKGGSGIEDVLSLMKFIGGFTSSIIGAHWAGYGTSLLLHHLASMYDSFQIGYQHTAEGEGGCALEPLGLGTRLKGLLANIISLGGRIRVSWLLRELAKDSKELTDTFTRGMMYGLAIWTSQPLSKLASAAFRDVLVIELPPLNLMEEITRRHISHDAFNEILNKYRMFLRLYGYRSDVIDWLTSTETSITITDRFGQQRKIFLSPIYELPSATDVARMMVRDIFASISDFQKLYMARGMMPDIGALYYFLRFRYPSPETLWKFMMRGISGFLWVSITQDELNEIKKEVEELNAGVPIPPTQLNFKPEILLPAFKTYMKWHDLFRGSWFKEEVQGFSFTSDNLLYLDTLADVPTKIDQRWMVKWGLYEMYSDLPIKTTLRKMVEKFLTQAGESKITLDLRHFCRTLQATGIHPDWIPMTAVGEAFNMLTEERTLLRTGFMNLFKEGFWDVSSLDKFLAGIIKVKVSLGYFNVNTLDWEERNVLVPIRYLPAESKLMELRALMDRSLDILREIQRDVSTAYQEFIIWDYNEYKSKLTQTISSINEVFSKTYEQITGETLKEELKLKFVEDYYKPYVEALRIWRDVYTIRRIRSWTQRFLGWLLYRVATGVVEIDEFKDLITYVADTAKLTEKEKNYLEKLVERLFRIATRDYVPTPSQLATLAEYVVVSEKVIERVFEERRIPEEWKAIWKQYIAIRPVADDVKSMLTTYRRAILYAELPKESIEKIEKYMELIGFTDREKEILDLRIELEELIQQSREYIPTPSMLATIAEYVVITPDHLKKVFDARRVPDEWRDIWAKYISVRPIANDIRALISAYRRALLYIKIPQELESKIREYMKSIGFTEAEEEIFNLRVRLEEMILDAREYIPTPMTLATLAEHVKLSDELINSVFDARRVPKEWRNIWKQYISVRPMAGEIMGMLSAYRRALLYVKIPQELESKIKEYAELINFTKEEFELLSLRATIEKMILDAREYVPTPSMLATIAEYVPEAVELSDKVFDVMRVPKEWRDIWTKYISTRPISSDVRELATLYERALAREIPKDQIDKLLSTSLEQMNVKSVDELLKAYGWTDREMWLLKMRVMLESYMNDVLEARREYIPTPSMLATLAEYVPKAREFKNKVFKARRIPDEWKPIWESYIDLRPIVDEVKRMLSRAEDLYVYFIVSEETYKKILDQTKFLGYTDREIELILRSARFERQRRAWVELAGDMDRMMTLAEYSPQAREFALAQLYKMIDSLPAPDETKQVLKEMWEQFIRLRPVMDEVRRYVTELINDFVEGVITEEEFVSELEALREWGLDDYEIMFYRSIAGMRKARYLKRRARGS